MKNFLKLMLLAAICVLAAGCSKKVEQPGFKIYCTDSGRTKLAEENFEPASRETDAMIREMLAKLKAKPDTAELESAIPQDVHVLEFTLNGRQLTLSFDEAYLSLDNITEVLLRAAVVKSLVQIDQVDQVFFQIGENALLDDSGNWIGAMTADTFIDTKGKGINSYQFACLTLYFANADGNRLVKELRNVHYSTNTTLEKVVIEQLIAGPANAKLQPVLPSDTKLMNVTVDKALCTVNFDENFNKEISTQKIDPEVTVYAVVNSIVDSCGVSRIQMQVAGNSEVLYAKQVSLKEPFERNKDMIWQIEAEEQTSEAAAEPDSEDGRVENDSNTHEPNIGIDPILKNEIDQTGDSQ